MNGGEEVNLTDNEIMNALDRLKYGKHTYSDALTAKNALDLINRKTAENKDLFYKLTGVMHSVDKWLEGDELKGDEVQRACTMREKTLKITERQKAEIEDLQHSEEVLYRVKEGLKVQVKGLQDEVEIKTNMYNDMKKQRDEEHRYCMHYVIMIAKARTEAIKEFAERLIKSYESINGQFVDHVMLDIIDNLVKEMVGDLNEHKNVN